MEQKNKRKFKFRPEIVALILVALLVIAGGIAVFISNIPKSQTSGGSSFVESSSDGNSASFSGASDDSIQSVAKKLTPSVVSIIGRAQSRSSFFYGYNSETASAGTGVIVTSDGYILTNKHVVEDTTNIQVVLSDGTTYENAKIAALDPLNDVAFLKISNVSNLTPAELGDSKTLNIGQEVIAIGNALGQYQGTVTSGIISGVNRSLTAESSNGTGQEDLTDMIQTDAAINSGNSGGPLVNAKGQVIGINTAVADANGIGFAIPISATKGMLKSLVSSGSGARVVLGVSYIALNPAIAKEENLSVKYGAWLKSQNGQTAVRRGSSAEKIGLKEGDIIVAINGSRIGAAGSVSSLVSEYSAGETIKITIVRENKEIELSAKLDAYPK
ncbi:MAG: trypsin-like peptidase domain-containing protein [Candidatus Nanogingivalis sp.]